MTVEDFKYLLLYVIHSWAGYYIISSFLESFPEAAAEEHTRCLDALTVRFCLPSYFPIKKCLSSTLQRLLKSDPLLGFQYKLEHSFSRQCSASQSLYAEHRRLPVSPSLCAALFDASSFYFDCELFGSTFNPAVEWRKNHRHIKNSVMATRCTMLSRSY